MLTKSLVLKSLVTRNVVPISGALARNYHGGNSKVSTMDDLPIPQGDWQEQHHKQQSKHNAILALGIIALGGAIGLAKSSGLVQLNYSPPKSLD